MVEGVTFFKLHLKYQGINWAFTWSFSVLILIIIWRLFQTLPERYDFYLVSHSAGQGTANPSSYNVIYDTSKLPAATMQLITYKMCHMYYNWPGTVRVICYFSSISTSVNNDANLQFLSVYCLYLVIKIAAIKTAQANSISNNRYETFI